MVVLYSDMIVGWSPNVTYIYDTIIIDAPYGWIPGHQYYVTFDNGWYCFIFVDCTRFLFV